MQEEWVIVRDGDTFYLDWGPHRVATFDADVVVEEMEGVAEKLNEGGPFDGMARVVPA